MAIAQAKEDDGTGTTQESEAEEEFHDADTQQKGFTPTLSGSEWREMHVLLELTYRSQAEAALSPKKHLAILTAMYNAFPSDELIIFDNKGRKVNRTTCGDWKDIEAYKACYTLHEGYGRQMAIFRIRTTHRFGTIKRDKQVWEQLHTSGSYLKRHHWPEDKWQITTLGFLCLMDPSRHQGDDVRENIIALAMKEKSYTKTGEKFQLIPARFKIKHKGNTATHAFGIQCLKEDATAVDAMLKGAYHERLTYVKNKLKKAHKDAYVNAMILQNVYLTKANTVVAVGITRQMMEQLRPNLLTIKIIDYVTSTAKTDLVGRWDLICMDVTHNQLINILTKKLDNWLDG